ncbi:LysR family transcriptional regulator [Oleidesulfovibrio sp.]|uniref:LysR family transcriptional regulator n=1 Tax=Oleidesulfovibrio sp. TaxID=2909707 RepID=UPI003A860520
MELYQLHSFVTVAEQGHLTRAARKRHISQSSLSAQIKALEESLGVLLFMRTPKGMKLTEQGMAMLEHARSVIEAAGNMQSAAEAMQKSETAMLLIGLNTDPLFLRMTQLEAASTNGDSRIRLRFLPSQTLTTTEMLHDKIMDAGFRFGFSNQPDIHDICVTEVPLRAVIPVHLLPEGITADGYNPSWPELAALPWIWGDCVCPLYDAASKQMSDHGVSPNVAAEAIDERIVRELLLNGRGVAIMRLDECEELAKQGTVVLCGEDLSVPLCLSHLATRKNETALKTLANIASTVWQS